MANGIDVRLTVRNDLSRGKRNLCFHLEVDGSTKSFDPVTLELEPGKFFSEFFRQIKAASRDAETISAKSIELTQSICPPDLLEILYDINQSTYPNSEAKTLLIQSEEGWIPWEFLRLRQRRGRQWKNGVYFCEAFAMTRWRGSELPRRLQLPLHHIGKILIPGKDLISAEDESQTLERYWESLGCQVTTIPAERHKVLDYLGLNELDAVHLIGHGGVDEYNINTSSIRFDAYEEFTPEMLSKFEGRFYERHPLVFFNSCHSSRGGQALNDVGGWATKFIEAGVGAFIGTSWGTEDRVARNFSVAFYENFFRGYSIGEAARQARKYARDTSSGDLTSWLAYTVFADPLTKWKSKANIEASIIRIENSGNDSSEIGTAFAIHQETNRMLILTSLRVIANLGGVEALRIDGHHVRLVAAGSSEGPNDLAVLEISGSIDARPLRLDPAGHSGERFKMAAWTWLSNNQLNTRVVGGTLDEPTYETGSTSKKVEVWNLQPSSPIRFEKAFSGAPVINVKTGSVIAVFSSQVGGKARAISVAALRDIWPTIPAELLDGDDLPPGERDRRESDSRRLPLISAPKRIEVNQVPRQIRQSMDPSKVPQRLLQEIAQGQVVPVIGAGLSMSASLEGGGSIMPSYAELIDQLLERAREIDVDDEHIHAIESALAESRTLEAVQGIRSALGRSFGRELRSILNPIEQDIQPSPAHKLLRILGFRQILTTNYDRLLEIFVAPKHEVVTPSDASFKTFFNDDVQERFIFKIHGDITRPETISFGADRLKERYEDEELGNFLRVLSLRRTLLFLGYSFENASEDYASLLGKYLRDCPRSHYALVPYGASNRSFRRKLTAEANIRFLEYYPDEQHSQVWEFISYLSAGKRDEPVIGQKWAQWYLPSERADYLSRQLSLERRAGSTRYMTPGLTNALATDAYLRRRVLPTFDKPGVRRIMLERRDHLETRLREGSIEVRCMFLKNEFDAELERRDPIVLERYRHVLELLQDDSIDLELRLIPDLEHDEFKRQEATYALILSSEPGPEGDVALAYASQATTEFFALHMVEINTETVMQRVFKFERYWSAAWTEQKTLHYMKHRLAEVEDEY